MQAATGLAVFVWLALVFGTDLGLMAGTLAADLSIEWLFRLAAASPLQAFKMASLQSVDASVDVLGPAGLYAKLEYGPSLGVWLGGVLAVWTVVPLGVSMVVFGKRSPL
jgi:Cu-processing system permease protein